MPKSFTKNLMYYKFCLYGFLKNLNFFEPFLILFFLEKGFNYFQIGLLYSVQSISTNILEIPTGIFADSIGRRRTMVYSMLSYIFAFIIFYFTNDFLVACFAMILMAFGDAFRTGTHKAMIFQYLKLNNWQDQKVYYYGHTRSWSQMGSAISAIIAGLIVFYTGKYKYVFILSTIPYILDLILLLTYPKELDGEHKSFHFKDLGNSFGKVISEFWTSIRNKKVIRAIVNSSSYSGYFDATKDYLQPVLKSMALALPIFIGMEQKSRSAIIIAIVYFLLNILTSFSSRNAGRFSERFKNIYIPMNITLLVGLFSGFIAGFFEFQNLQIIAIIFFVVMYMVHNLRRPLGEAYITESLKEDILATALSTESQITTLITAILAPILGKLADLYGPGIALMLISGFLIIIYPLYYAKNYNLDYNKN